MILKRALALIAGHLGLMGSLLQAEPSGGSQVRNGPSVYFPQDHGTRSWAFSTGDSVAVADMFPVENQTQVDQVLAQVDDLFNIHRILWRGEQDDRVMSGFKRFDDYYRRGMLDLFERLTQQKTSEMMARAAKARGIEFWGFDTLTEVHNMPWVDSGKGLGSSYGVMKFAYDHPEWIPVDRIGLRQQGGMISYAYPEARRAFVDSYDQFLTTHPYYQGIWLYSYVENFEEQYEDEFGFEEPIVAEYKRRYGVDIRTQPFDHQKWYDLKGEYFTQFIRELHAVFQKHGVKMAICVDPTHLDRPTPWLCGGAVLRPTGRFTMEWRKWIKEGLVDELSIYCVGGEDFYWKAYQEVAEAVKGTPVHVSVYNSRPLPARWNPAFDGGLDRIMQDMPMEHEGYAGERPLTDIASNDPYAKLNVLHQLVKSASDYTMMLTERIKPDPLQKDPVGDTWILKNVAPLLADKNVMVRREAVNVLAGVKDPAVVPLLEGALLHDENTVQCLAARALGKINGPNTVAAFRAALAHNHNWCFGYEAIMALDKFPVERQAERLSCLKDADPYIRNLFAYSYSRHSISSPEVREALLGLVHDPDEDTRYAAVSSLGNCGPEVKDALLDVVHNDNAYLAQRAAIDLANIFGERASQAAARKEIAEALQSLFARFGEGPTFREHDWAWRPVGNSLYNLGPVGQNILRDFLLNGKDKLLSDRAWQCLYARVDGWGWRTITEDQAIANYRYAQFRPGAQIPPVFETAPEVQDTPAYLRQNFDTWSLKVKGTVGDATTPAGAWSVIGEAPSPVLQADRVYSGKALELTNSWRSAEPGGVAAARSEPLPAGSVDILSCRINLPQRGTQLLVGMKDEKSGKIVGCVLAGDGTISGTSGSSVANAVQAEDWNRIGIVYDLARHTMTVKTGAQLDRVLLQDLPLPADASLTGFAAVPSGSSSGKAYLDDVEIAAGP